jgi:integrase
VGIRRAWLVTEDQTGCKRWNNLDLASIFSASLRGLNAGFCDSSGMETTHARVGIAPLLVEYERWQVSTGTPARDAAHTRRELDRTTLALGWAELDDLAGGRTAYETFLLAAAVSSKTKHNKRAMMASFQKWLRDRDMLPDPWASRVTLPRILEVDEPRALSAAEFDRLVACARADEAKPPKGPLGNRSNSAIYRRHDADRSELYLVARWTGLRLGEMQAMRRGWIQVRTPEPHIAIPARAAKSRQVRRVPLIGPALDILRRHAQGDPDAKVWASWPHPKVIDTDFESAGIRDAGQWHSLRKTFITDALARNIDPLKLAMIVGHRDLRTTLRHYTDPRLMGLSAALTDMMASAGNSAAGKIRGNIVDPEAGNAEDTPAEVVHHDAPTPKQLDDNARAVSAHGGLQQFTNDRDCPGVAVESHDPIPQCESLTKKGSPPRKGRENRIGVAGFEPASLKDQTAAEILQTAATLLLQVSRLLNRTQGRSDDDEDRRSER